MESRDQERSLALWVGAIAATLLVVVASLTGKLTWPSNANGDELAALVRQVSELAKLQADAQRSLRDLTEEIRRSQDQDSTVGISAARSGSRTSAPEPSSRAQVNTTKQGYTELLAAVQALQQSIEHQNHLLEERLPRSEMTFSTKEIDMVAVDDLMLRWQTDPEGAQQTTMLLTPADLIKAYGRPSEVWANASKGLFFAYIRNWGNEAPVQVGFKIVNGLVVESWHEPFER